MVWGLTGLKDQKVVAGNRADFFSISSVEGLGAQIPAGLPSAGDALVHQIVSDQKICLQLQMEFHRDRYFVNVISI
jgi:hypothetical protein